MEDEKLDKYLARFTQKMIHAGTIEKEDEAIYIFGLHQGIMLLLNLLTTLMIGLIFGMVWESLFLLLVYIPIRSYAGGYHARTELQCYILSVVMIVSMLWIVKSFSGEILLNFIMFVIGVVSILFLAPLGDKNKPLDDMEQIVYRKRARILLSIESLFFGIFLFFSWNIVAMCISVSLFGLACLLFIAALKMKLEVHMKV